MISNSSYVNDMFCFLTVTPIHPANTLVQSNWFLANTLVQSVSESGSARLPQKLRAGQQLPRPIFYASS